MEGSNHPGNFKQHGAEPLFRMGRVLSGGQRFPHTSRYRDGPARPSGLSILNPKALPSEEGF
jgi:hypothetical protein